ncbi:MAG: porphobilinogen synthase [Litorilinea sp.]
MTQEDLISHAYSANRGAGGFNQALRPRRLRRTPALRALVRETRLTADDLIQPYFVVHGTGVANPISSMPGVNQLSVDRLVETAGADLEAGVRAVLLFGIPATKDPIGLENFADDGIVQQGIRALKAAHPEILVITDVCLCEYTDHGHCGLLSAPVASAATNGAHSAGVASHAAQTVEILNDETLEVLAKVAISHAQAGADIIAPSGMMDGMVATLRAALDGQGHLNIPIMSYAVKYASAFYGPFREAADGAPRFGDRRAHQMDPGNVREALREAQIDVDEGADFLMVKPALAYLDVIHALAAAFPTLPLAAYNVSGEYAMIKAAAQRGWIDESNAALEMLTGMKRAGADLIITYFAGQAARYLRTGVWS